MNRQAQQTVTLILSIVAGIIGLIIAASGDLELTRQQIAILGIVAAACALINGQLEKMTWSRASTPREIAARKHDDLTAQIEAERQVEADREAMRRALGPSDEMP